MEKMTKKIALTMAIDALKSVENSETAIDILKKEIDRLNTTSVRASIKRAEKAEMKANELIEQIKSVFIEVKDTPLSATDIADYIDDETITKSKVSYRLGRMVKDNILSKEIAVTQDTLGNTHRTTVYKLINDLA